MKKDKSSMAVDLTKLERAIEKMADMTAAANECDKCLKFSQSAVNLTNSYISLLAKGAQRTKASVS